MGSMTDGRRYRARPDVLVRIAPGFVAIARPDGVNLTLTGTGAALWQLLGEPRTMHDLSHDLAERYDVDPQRVADDIAPVLAELQDEQFLQVQ